MTPPTSMIAIIPARGGSKRLPRKNVADFLGKPIIAWTIEAAQAAGCFDRIIVSTEDVEIAAVARRFGAEVDDRPAALVGDTAGVVDVCLNLFDRLEAQGAAPDAFCCLYATAPLRTADDIRQVVGLLEPGVCDFAMAITDYDLPPYRALRQDADGTLAPMWPDLAFRKSQEVPPLVVNNGSTYAATVAAFRENRTFTGPGTRGHVMPRDRSTDIDDQAALDRARALGRAAGLESGSASADPAARPVDVWRGDFGKTYVDRNEVSEQRFAERSAMWQRVLEKVPTPDLTSLVEVGANIGLNLRALGKLTGARMVALEPNPTARERLRADGVVADSDILDGDATAIPLADGAVDLAFTCGVLIHVPPDELAAAYREMHRVSRRYVLSIEYFSPRPEALPYRGHQGLLFKRDFGGLWLDSFDDLELVDYGFFWKRVSGQDDVTWWLFRKKD